VPVCEQGEEVNVDGLVGVVGAVSDAQAHIAQSAVGTRIRRIVGKRGAMRAMSAGEKERLSELVDTRRAPAPRAAASHCW